MNNVFNELLVSCPNEQGGTFYIKSDEVYCLNRESTTGLSYSDNKLFKGIQPDILEKYHERKKEVFKTALTDDIHDVLEYKGAIYVVGTMKNSVLKLDDKFNVIQEWKLEGEDDSKHINCLCVWNDKVVYSAFGEFVEHRGYKGKSQGAGFVAELETGIKLITGLSQPHSLFNNDGNLIIANSQKCELIEYANDGSIIRTKELNGYTRGVYVGDDYVYVGLSCSRNTDVMSTKTATVIALRKNDWQEQARIELPAKEIYSICLLSCEKNTLELLLTHCDNNANDMYRMNETLKAKEFEFSELANRFDAQEKRIELLAEELEKVHNSHSWKMTYPLRKLRTFFK